MLTGQGPPRHGLPLRGQNNVQGASDAGLIPMVFLDYQRVDNTAVHDKFEALCAVLIPSRDSPSSRS